MVQFDMIKSTVWVDIFLQNKIKIWNWFSTFYKSSTISIEKSNEF